MTLTELRKCPRCIKGRRFHDGTELVCFACGFRENGRRNKGLLIKLTEFKRDYLAFHPRQPMPEGQCQVYLQIEKEVEDRL